MGARRKGRELAVQALYQIELTGETSPAALRAFWEQSEAGANAKGFAAALVAGAWRAAGTHRRADPVQQRALAL